MVAIAPFRALRYDPAAVELPMVTSPPHDCITEEERDRLLAAEARSIVRVVLGPEEPGDAEPPGAPNKFLRAAAALQRWVSEGVLRRDPRPAFYAYEVLWGPPGDRRRMHALLGRLALDPTYREVLPHEHILRGKKRDRLRLREATAADTEPIWLLYRDRRGWVDEVAWSNAGDDLVRFTAPDGSEHRLAAVDRPEAVAELRAQFDERTLVIADGHHRYQTALDHHAATGDPRHGSILVALVRDSDPGLAIEATHRVVLTLPFGPAEALRRAAVDWDATRLPAGDPTRLAGSVHPDGRDVVLVLPDGGETQNWLLTLKPGHEADPALGRLASLAVTRLHELLLRKAWGIDVDHPEDALRFTRDAQSAVARVARGEAAAALLLAPESVASVLEVAQEGRRMPQKATYFVPKLRSGIVLSPLDEPLPRRWMDSDAPVA